MGKWRLWYAAFDEVMAFAYFIVAVCFSETHPTASGWLCAVGVVYLLFSGSHLSDIKKMERR